MTRWPPVRRLTVDVARDRTPSFSPDGRFVYFASDRRGSFEVWRLEVATGAMRPLFEGYAPREFGGWIYYTRARGNGLYRRPLREAAETPPAHGVSAGEAAEASEEVVVPDLTPVDRLNWAFTARGIVFIERPEPSKPRLVRLDLDTGARTVFPVVSRFYHFSGLAIGPAGRVWLAQVLSSETDLYRIEMRTLD